MPAGLPRQLNSPHTQAAQFAAGLQSRIDTVGLTCDGPAPTFLFTLTTQSLTWLWWWVQGGSHGRA